MERFHSVASRKSKIGIVVDIWHRHPARDDDPEDIALAEKENEESYRFFEPHLQRPLYGVYPGKDATGRNDAANAGRRFLVDKSKT